MKNFKYSILAGIMIGIGGIAYLSVESKLLGAFLFSFGLITIMYQKYNLFTGQIGYVKDLNDLIKVVRVLIFNCLSVTCMGLLSSFWLKDEVLPIIQKKLATAPLETFIKATLCGIVIYLAVELFKKDKKGLWTPICIILFILCGFEHCIANTFYFATANYFSYEVFIFTLITIIGNSFGSLLIAYLENKKERLK
jgi:formate/nitrite transporter FocA (FNT family)